MPKRFPGCELNSFLSWKMWSVSLEGESRIGNYPNYNVVDTVQLEHFIPPENQSPTSDVSSIIARILKLPGLLAGPFPGGVAMWVEKQPRGHSRPSLYLPSVPTGCCYRPGTGQDAWGTGMSDSVALSRSQTRRETDVLINCDEKLTHPARRA